jgi:hypothetical protein
LRGALSPQAAIEKWRQSDGRVLIKNLLVARGKQTRSYSGQLTLDDKHDLSGTVSAKDHAMLRFEGNRIVRDSSLP